MPRAGRLLAALSASLMLGACAQLGDGEGPQLLSSLGEDQPAAAQASNQTELEKATGYWGKEYAKNPRNVDAALAYAKNLKAMGQKRQALAVLQQASVYNGANKSLASEYGRLALEFDQISVAKQMLQVADDPANPDWKVISARGTAFAKEGAYGQAIPLYERALTLAPDHPSVMSNLALAYAMNGQADKAEPMLRKASAADAGNAKVRQNLALVLGLQGKLDEAKRVAAADLTPEAAASNAELMRKLVKVEPKDGQPATSDVAGTAPALKPATADASASDGWTTKVAQTPAR